MECFTIKATANYHPTFSIDELGCKYYLSIVSTQRNQLQDDMHFRLMNLIERNPKVSQREIAEQLGMSLGAINYCIKALIEKGYIKVSNFTGNPRKLSYAYLLTPTGIIAKTALTGQFLKRKLAEYEALKLELELLQITSPREPLELGNQGIFEAKNH